MGQATSVSQSGCRIGAVRYLNAWPLAYRLREFLPQAEVVFDLPSRLADALAAGQLDVAMIPSVECLRIAGTRIVSDACIAAAGPVQSVKLYGRCPIEELRVVALDEGSRTSAALVRILLKERFGLSPQWVPLPIGATLEQTTADAVLLVGDRGLLPPQGEWQFIWDLAQEWAGWTGLPFVFATWVGRPGADLGHLAGPLAAARDAGLGCLDEIAASAAPVVGVPYAQCLAYLRKHLVYRLGPQERLGMTRFRELVIQNGLAPAEARFVFDNGHP